MARSTPRGKVADLIRDQAKAEHNAREDHRRRLIRDGANPSSRRHFSAYPVDALRAPGALYHSGTQDETDMGWYIDLAGGSR